MLHTLRLLRTKAKTLISYYTITGKYIIMCHQSVLQASVCHPLVSPEYTPKSLPSTSFVVLVYIQMLFVFVK